MSKSWEFSSGLGVKNVGCHHGGLGLIPGLGISACCGHRQKKKKKKGLNFTSVLKVSAVLLRIRGTRMCSSGGTPVVTRVHT